MSTHAAGVRTAPIVPPGTWVVDPTHSNVEFAVKHMGIATVRGRFTEFEGTLVSPTSSTTQAVRQGPGRVDHHRRRDPTRASSLPGLLRRGAYPEITFESTRVEAIDADTSQVFGNLTMHGVTREIKLQVAIHGTEEDPWGNTRVGLEAVGVIKRSDFDMKFNQAFGSATCSSEITSRCRWTSRR